MDLRLGGEERSAMKNGSQHFNCGPGDVCCVSAGLNIRICLGAAEDWGTGGEWTEDWGTGGEWAE